eukprot:TRINITY_DN8315_c0_g1_i1.p1 TRINITY_DN8315_c0_g1~~TRINITY_DN8315_c0_g1_i1.p1  ORF type:complete len:512 (+),score=85.20 TRINITY_DN8315_c0_g1_i1:70-1605(+)
MVHFLKVAGVFVGICLLSLLISWPLLKSKWLKTFNNAEDLDTKDCYFDPECHAKVDWGKVGEVKGGFFSVLETLKKNNNVKDVKLLMERFHRFFLHAGMPDDRIDYILQKWVRSSYPQAMPTNVVVSGFSCENSYGNDLNQEYAFQGTTKDGRPYYRGTQRQDRYIYYDKYCADDTRAPRWLLGGHPDISREFNLNQEDGNGCDNDFSIVGDSMQLPSGEQTVAWQWCGDHGYSPIFPNTLSRKRTVSITYVEQVAHSADECKMYQNWGSVAMQGCRRCAKAYPGSVSECFACGKNCGNSCPKESEFECYTRDPFLSCHKSCMSNQSTESKHTPDVDSKDCYFNPECKAKVDWDKIGQLKEGFFLRLKVLKEKEDTEGVKSLLTRAHQACLDAGMPQDRIDYMLEKWVRFAYPEALSVPDVHSKDCYFNPECKAKVDWDKIGQLKEGFFLRLKVLKEKEDTEGVKSLLTRAHQACLDAGMPQDRIDYMLEKWVRFAYPEALSKANELQLLI